MAQKQEKQRHREFIDRLYKLCEFAENPMIQRQAVKQLAHEVEDYYNLYKENYDPRKEKGE